MRQPEPRWRKTRKTWVCRLNGQLHTLAHGKDAKQEAWEELRRLLTQQRPKSSRLKITFAELAELFLEWCQREKTPSTYEWYQYLLSDFGGFRGGKRAERVEPQDLLDWFKHRGFGSGTRNRAVGAVNRVFTWGIKFKKIHQNPIQGMERPRKPRREIYVTQAQREEILACYKHTDPFRDFLFAMEQTGCRPGEIAGLTSENLAEGLWILRKHKTKNQTGKARIIYLSDAMVQLTQRLVAQVPPRTPLFRNRDGKPWNRNSVRCRMRRVREKLKIPGLVAYLFRHGFITQALERGISDAIVAALAGHSSTETIHRHYNHLAENAKLLREAANKAVR